MGVRLVARAVRGVETVLAEEIHARGLGIVEELRHREVWFRCDGPGVLDLRCADDVLLVGAVVRGIGRRKDSLEALRAGAEAVPVRELQRVREELGGPGQPTSIDVSASYLGRRNFNRYDIEDVVGAALARGVRYFSRRSGLAPPEGGMSWRVTVAGEQALLGLRIGTGPLHRRAYRRATRPGSLHPPLAAAMVRLARPAAGERLLDPCCGVGTIAIEAADERLCVAGSDHSAAAIRAAQVNGAGKAITWLTADAGSLPLAAESVDVVVCNPPWDRQVPAAGRLRQDPGRFWAELRRVLRPDGRAVVLLTDVDSQLTAAAKAGLAPQERYPISLSGTHPEIVLLSPR